MLVRGPQAFRLALAPMTNDFVALLKDSSLVSVLTVVELTKQTSIFATNIGNWAIPGALCAALYLVLSLPLSRLARNLDDFDGERLMVSDALRNSNVALSCARRAAAIAAAGRLREYEDITPIYVRLAEAEEKLRRAT